MAFFSVSLSQSLIWRISSLKAVIPLRGTINLVCSYKQGYKQGYVYMGAPTPSVGLMRDALWRRHWSLEAATMMDMWWHVSLKCRKTSEAFMLCLRWQREDWSQILCGDRGYEMLLSTELMWKRGRQKTRKGRSPGGRDEMVTTGQWKPHHGVFQI